VAPFADGVAHLLAELDVLDLRLAGEVARLRAGRAFQDDPFRGLHIPDALADAALAPAALADPAWDRRVEEAAAAVAARVTPDLPLPRLTARFGLDRFEVDVLVLAAAAEADERYATLFAYAQNDVTRKRPTAGLALRLFHPAPDARLRGRAAFGPAAPLAAFGLVGFADDPADRDPPLPARPLRAADRVVRFLLGDASLDPELAGTCRFDATSPAVADLPHSDAVRRVLDGVATRLAGGGACVFVGPTGSGRRLAAGAVFAATGRSLLTVAADLPAAAAIAVRREAGLLGAGLCVTGCDPADADRLRALAAGPAPVVFCAAAAVPALGPAVAFPPLPFGPRLRLWEGALNGSATAVPPADLAAVATMYRVGPDGIAAAVHTARATAALRGPAPVTAADLRSAAAGHAGPTLRRLARKVESPHAWADLVVPADTLARLREVSAAVRHRPTVHAAWGFGRRLATGGGVAVLFSGPSGTGKTMAAAILAREVGAELYAIDLAAVVSKYIGETEKNLDRLFDEAAAASAALFFDEADALFGKRSAVADAHDRYANIEVAFLLQRLEQFDGLVVLATNLPKNLDDAFARRLGHAVEFPFPPAALRERLWRSVFPSQTPLGPDADFAFLARQFELSGGNIRNVALGAAFRAAGRGGPVGMADLIPAVARELQKGGKLPAKADFGPYYDLIRPPRELP